MFDDLPEGPPREVQQTSLFFWPAAARQAADPPDPLKWSLGQPAKQRRTYIPKRTARTGAADGFLGIRVWGKKSTFFVTKNSKCGVSTNVRPEVGKKCKKVFNSEKWTKFISQFSLVQFPGQDHVLSAKCAKRSPPARSTLRALKAERNGGRDSPSSTTPLSPDSPAQDVAGAEGTGLLNPPPENVLPFSSQVCEKNAL